MKNILVFALLLSVSASAEVQKLKPRVGNIVDVEDLGVSLVINDSKAGYPIAAIYDENGRYYAEVQHQINEEIKDYTYLHSGFHAQEVQILTEQKAFNKSDNSYKVVVLTGYTVKHGGDRMKKIAYIPIQRFISKARGHEINDGSEWWKRTQTRIISE